ncbi:MAG: DUF2279 domain-containing protein [Sphingobium phenoxybenzoativorans]
MAVLKFSGSAQPWTSGAGKHFRLVSGALVCGWAFARPAYAHSVVETVISPCRSAWEGIPCGIEPGRTGFVQNADPSLVDQGDGDLTTDPGKADLDRSDTAAAPAVYGPGEPQPQKYPENAARFRSFGSQFRTIRWEVAAAATYMTVLNIEKIVKEGGKKFHFQNEGFFGKNTINLGLDKLAHAYDTYLFAEILRARIDRKTGGEARGSAVTAALLASGLMLYGEVYDGLKKSSGFSWQDVVMNTSGAAFSIIRNEVPGLKEKLDFRVLVTPNSDVYTFDGTRHFRQQRYLAAFKLAGVEKFKKTPLRLVELHMGYMASGFTARERERGDPLKHRIFFGIGLNVGELLFGSTSTRAGRAARSVLNYVQVPYTAVHVHD